MDDGDLTVLWQPSNGGDLIGREKQDARLSSFLRGTYFGMLAAAGNVEE